MAQDIHKMIDRLNDLIALDRDAVGAYEAAIERIKTESIRARLRAFQADHERHIRDLSDVVVRFGGKARERPDLKGFAIKGFTAVTSMMGDQAALQAMRGNEVLTNRTYKAALEAPWPDDVRGLIERNFNDEQRHLAAIEKDLRDHAWESEAAHP